MCAQDRVLGCLVSICLTKLLLILTVSKLSETEGYELVSTIDRMLRREEVEERVGISRSAIYRLMRAGEFPAPRRVGLRAVRWSESDLEAWLASRPHATGNKAAA